MGPGVRIYSETDFECVRGVLNTAVASLLSDADGVVLVGQVDSPSKVVALQSSSRSRKPLGTAGPWSPLCSALYLTLYEIKLIKDPGIILQSPPDLNSPAGSSTPPLEPYQRLKKKEILTVLCVVWEMLECKVIQCNDIFLRSLLKCCNCPLPPGSYGGPCYCHRLSSLRSSHGRKQ